MAQAACGGTAHRVGAPGAPQKEGLIWGQQLEEEQALSCGEEAGRVCGKGWPGKPTSRGVTVLGALGDG